MTEILSNILVESYPIFCLVFLALLVFELDSGGNICPPPTMAKVADAPTRAWVKNKMTKFERNRSKSFWASDVLVTAYQAISDKKTTEVQTAVEPRVLKQIAKKR